MLPSPARPLQSPGIYLLMMIMTCHHTVLILLQFIYCIVLSSLSSSTPPSPWPLQAAPPPSPPSTVIGEQVSICLLGPRCLELHPGREPSDCQRAVGEFHQELLGLVTDGGWSGNKVHCAQQQQMPINQKDTCISTKLVLVFSLPITQLHASQFNSFCNHDIHFLENLLASICLIAA